MCDDHDIKQNMGAGVFEIAQHGPIGENTIRSLWQAICYL